MRTISKEWLAFLREQFPRGSQVICWELDDPEHISTGTLEQIDEEGRFHTRMGDGAIRKLALGEEQFSVQPPEPTLLKLYMPLTADFYGRDEWGDIDETGEEWDGRTLLDYKDATDLIHQAAGTGPPQLIRRLTPLECERLQGFPDGWTDLPGASDSARYRALGNSVAIPCVEFIMRGVIIAAGYSA